MALISKDNRNWAKSDSDYLIVCVNKSMGINKDILELLKKYYVYDRTTNMKIYIMGKRALVKFAKEHNWNGYSALRPFKSELSEKEIIDLIKKDNTLANFQFVSKEIEDEVKK